MGKGGEKGGESGEPEAQIRFYTWEEIQKHTLRTDKWLVIERKVYNVTQWANRHPGGHRVISHCAGEDATVRTPRPAPRGLPQRSAATADGSPPRWGFPRSQPAALLSPPTSLTPAAQPAPLFPLLLGAKRLVQIDAALWQSVSSVEPRRFAASRRWAGRGCLSAAVASFVSCSSSNSGAKCPESPPLATGAWLVTRGVAAAGHQKG